jgi:hypothetical protein
VVSGCRLQGSHSFIMPDATKTSDSLLVNGKYIKNIPHHTFRYGVRIDPSPRLSLSVWGRSYLVTKTADPIMMQDTIPAVALFDASVAYTWRMMTFQLIGTNLGNTYYERGGTVARPLAREGLNIEGALAMKF